MEHQTLPVHLSPPLLKHLLGAPLGLADLEATDPALHRSLRWLRDAPEAAEPASVAALHLDFTVAIECLGRTVVEELVPGGAHVPLTAANKV